MNLTADQRALLADAAAGRLSVSGVRFYRNNIQLDVHTGWEAFDLLGAGLLTKAEQKPGKYTQITISDSGRCALAAAIAEEQS